MHPNAHCVRLPSGSEIFFTFPIHLDTRQPMPPQDLEALAAYLERTQPPPVEVPDDPIYQNSLAVRSLISDWLQGSQDLDDMEMYAWESGHGFPIFDESGIPVDFQWVWDVIAFEGGEELVSRYVECINDSAELHAQAHAEDDGDSLRTVQALRRGDTFSYNSPVEQSQHQHFGRFRVGTKADGPVSVGGGNFENMDDCVAFLETFPETELKLLSKNIIQLEGDYSPTGLRIVPGPNAKFFSERASQAEKEAFQIHMSHPDPQSRHVLVQQEDVQPVYIHTITANPPSHSVIIRQEDQGPKPIVFFHKRAVKQGKKPVQEQKLTFKRVRSPPNQTVAAELDPFRFYGREPAHEARNQAVKDQRLFDERKSLVDKKAYAKAAAAAASLRGGGRESFKKEKTAAYEAEDQKLQNILARYSAHQAQSSSPSPASGVNLSRKSTRIPAPKTSASEARPKISGAEPSAHRDLSFQEPTRLPMRPKATGRSSSYDNTSVEDPAYRVYGTSVHQAHAEDSPDDSTESSPRPAPGSWMDALEELMS